MHVFGCIHIYKHSSLSLDPCVSNGRVTRDQVFKVSMRGGGGGGVPCLLTFMAVLKLKYE